MGVPNRVLFQATMAGGVRLPKLPKLEKYQWKPGTSYLFEDKRPGIVEVVRQIGQKIRSDSHLKIISSAVNNNEMRFWVASEYSNYSKCRACGNTAYNPEERKRHMEGCGCTGKLVNAYKLLLQERKCVICDKPTGGRQWGVPMCGEVCAHRWRYGLEYHMPLQRALAKTGAFDGVVHA